MYQSTYYVDQTTDTFADTLLAYGVASLLERLLQANVGQSTVRVQDVGGAYAIAFEDPIEESFADIDWFCDLPSIRTGRQQPPRGWAGQVVDYDSERERRNEYFEARKQLPKEARQRGATIAEYPALAAVENLRPRPDWDILAQIKQMQGIYAYSAVLNNWFACRPCFSDLLRLLLALFAQVPNDVAQGMATWKEIKKAHRIKIKDTVGSVQILNPGMGKGINRPKADRADLLGNLESFWVMEFLKFWGMRRAGVPRVVRSAQPGGSRTTRNRKTYVLAPLNLTLDTLDKVYTACNRAMWSNTAVKLDVLATMRLTDAFLGQWLAGQLADVGWNEEPGDHVKSLTTAFYKDMGNAVVVLNLSQIGLPRWMRVETPEQGQAYRAAIEEHRQVVDSLREDRSEEHRLLERYRDFLSGCDLGAFFQFTAGYAGVLTTRIERGQWAPRFTTTNLEVLIMEQDKRLGPILESEGFVHVAAAVRRSTVIPQHFKARGNRGPYQIRYGLGADLLRRAAYPDQFVQALGAFIQDYNRETAQVDERYKGTPPVRRAAVTTDDITEVVRLIDEYGSKTVANLLVAFGYAREPRDRGPETQEPRREAEEEQSEG